MKSGRESSFIYFIRPVGKRGPIKIGLSVRPSVRIEALMKWSPVPLEIVATCPGYFETEGRIHRHFIADHSHSEWFKASTRLDRFIEAIKSGVEVEKLIDFNSPFAGLHKGRKKKAFTAERRRCLSYSARVRIAFKKLRSEFQGNVPRRADKILDRWHGCKFPGREAAPIQPTAGQIKYLEAVIADPRKYAEAAA